MRAEPHRRAPQPGATVRWSYPLGVLRIEPLTDQTFDAFADMGRRTPPLSMCWCQYWRVRSKDFAALRVPDLRARLLEQATRAIPPGLVAIDDVGTAGGDDGAPVVGWVGLGPRGEFERIVRSRVIPAIDDRPAWSITCFAVPRSRRGQGIAAALLAGAIDFIRDAGAEAIEAYPVLGAPDGRMNAEAAFTGTWPMFQRAGFAIAADRASDPSATHPRVVVRRELRVAR